MSDRFVVELVGNDFGREDGLICLGEQLLEILSFLPKNLNWYVADLDTNLNVLDKNGPVLIGNTDHLKRYFSKVNQIYSGILFGSYEEANFDQEYITEDDISGLCNINIKFFDTTFIGIEAELDFKKYILNMLNKYKINRLY